MAKLKTITPRPFRGEKDLQQMRNLLIKGHQAANGTFYIHPGDLDWWLYYLPVGNPPWDNIFLWDDEESPDILAGWSLFSPSWNSFDVFVAPDWRASIAAEQIFSWSEEQLARLIKPGKDCTIQTMWIAAQDDWLSQMFNRHGFNRSDPSYVNMLHDLREPLPHFQLAQGYRYCQLSSTADFEQRAAAQYAVFQSTLPFQPYCERYRRFMLSPAYRRATDLVIEAPGGQVVAFCLLWTDNVNHIGLFEPVGVNPDYQNRGLGKALLAEGLRRFLSSGMVSAIVNVEPDNQPALHLYRSVGFSAACRLFTYSKTVPGDLS